MKNLPIIIVVLLLLAIAGGLYLFTNNSSYEAEPAPEPEGEVVVVPESDVEVDSDTDTDEMLASETETEMETDDATTIIGTSAGGNAITAYHFGEGDTEILFVGGIHGGYSWNTAAVAFEVIDHLEANPDVIPENVRVTVVPVMNPDGLEAVVGATGRFAIADAPTDQAVTTPGRFNANTVDLNRNFDCEWQAEGTWQDRTVSGGSAPFSEPEAAAMRDFVTELEPAAAVVWYSAAGGVYASNCQNGVSAGTTALLSTFSLASGYPAYEEFDFYEITGDMVNWMAKNDIPAISVLLTNHTDLEWSKNRAGVEAVLASFAQTDNE